MNNMNDGEYMASTTVMNTYINQSTQTSELSSPLFNVWQSALIGIFLVSIIIISIGGNILVCIAILTDNKLQKKNSNLLLMSLAISDLVVSCLVMPFAVANDILGYWPFAREFCNVWVSFDILSATASILNLCAISLDRYVSLIKPFLYSQYMKKRSFLLIIAVIWLASVLISFLPINLGWHQTESQVNMTVTTVAMPVCIMELNALYATISSSISFYIPCIIMITIYILTYRLARQQAESIKQTQLVGVINTTKSNWLKDNKALVTIGVIMGLFLISWIPFFIVNLVASYCVNCVPGRVFVACTWLGYCNSTMNPLIYSKFNSDFRQAFRKILCCEKFRQRDPYRLSNSSRVTNNSLSNKNATNGVGHNGHITKMTNLRCNNNDTNSTEMVELRTGLNKDPEEVDLLEEKSST